MFNKIVDSGRGERILVNRMKRTDHIRLLRHISSFVAFMFGLERHVAAMLNAQNLLRLRSAVLPGGIKNSSFRFIRSYRHPEIAKHVRQVASTSKHQRDENNKEKLKQSKQEDGRPRGSLIAVIGVIGIGGVLGWYFRAWRRRRRIASKWEFVKYELVKKEEVSSTCAIFSLKPSTSVVIDTEGSPNHRSITSVEFKQPQLQIARSYTLLPHTAGQDPRELRFLIRKERGGEVSSYLHALPLGSEIQLRGPNNEIEVPADTRDIIFLAGGTGIAPAMQLAAKCRSNVNHHILWACRRREDCRGGQSDSMHRSAWRGWSIAQWWASSHDSMPSTPAEPNEVVKELENLKHSWNDKRSCASAHYIDEDETRQMQQSKQTGNSRNDTGALIVDYYVDEEGTFIHPSTIAKVVQLHTPQNTVDDSGTRLILVSGPDGFINYWAGPKQWENGREIQGPLGGVLSTLELYDWKVFKL